MRFIPLLLTFLFFHTTSFCQTDTLGVPFVSYWSVGDVYEYKVTKIKKQWKEDILTKNDSTQYIATFNVIDSTDTSYTIRWTFKSDLTNTYNIPESLHDQLSEYSTTEVIYQTTELGEFVGIDNWEEIGEKMKGLFTELFEAMGEDKEFNKEDFQKSIQPLISVYSSKQGVEQLVFPELQYFHFPFGVEYSIDEPIEYEELIPNMFGGNPIKGDGVLSFESVDFENSHCVLLQQVKLDPNDAKDMILQLFMRMGLDNKEAKKAMKKAKFDITSNNRYDYYYYPGVPVKIETVRESLIDIAKEKGKRVDKLIVELQM